VFIDDYLLIFTPFTPQVILDTVFDPLPEQKWNFIRWLGPQ